MRYQIVRNPESLQDFIDWLPELKQNECFYVCLQARRKYSSMRMRRDSIQLRRFVADKHNLAMKIGQLECPIGMYHCDKGNEIPTEALSL